MTILLHVALDITVLPTYPVTKQGRSHEEIIPPFSKSNYCYLLL